MAASNLDIRIKVRWWVFTPYAKLLAFFALLTGREPDQDKVRAFIDKYCIKVCGSK